MYVHGPAKDFNDGDQATSILTLRNVIANSMWIECTGILHYIKGYCGVMKLGQNIQILLEGHIPSGKRNICTSLARD